MRVKLFYAKAARKITAIVVTRLDLYDKETGKWRLYKFQSKTLTSGIGTTNLPPHSRMSAIYFMISSLRFHGSSSR